jgi:hypothetical protein
MQAKRLVGGSEESPENHALGYPPRLQYAAVRDDAGVKIKLGMAGDGGITFLMYRYTI